MFLYFLQRKGWLGGQKRFLSDQFIDTVRRHAGEFRGDQETFYYYTEVLEPLFFETMNTRRLDNATRWSGVRIPYLNGGLFDKSRDPEGVIVLPDSLFDPNSSDGLLAFFNRYNFTIADDTPLEQDVAVDPEMLGKVFENMLEERDRGQTGSFYTPRTIVSYMCQEALAGYLEESANIPRDTTRAQFDPDADLPLTSDETQRINAALDTLTVLDPAVGSGSFLIGMLGEIILLRRACASALDVEVTPAMVADWKEAIIHNTLYGVDIKPEAIEIAQLRLWLALVVDQSIEQARPLPNLDYKLMAGNSLIETIDGDPVLTESANALLSGDDSAMALTSPVKTQMTLGMFDSQKERVKLGEMRQRYFNATPEERRELRAEITAQERKIVYSSLKEKAEAQQQKIDMLGKMAGQAGGRLGRTDQRKLEDANARLGRITDLQEQMRNPETALPFFLYRLHFSEVFATKDGFDVVIANPPYVRSEKLGDLKTELKEAYPKVYRGTADLYVYFFVRALDLLRKNGQLAFITSNKYLRAKYGEGLREFLSEKMRFDTLIDFGDLPIFDAAAYPCIAIGSKRTKIDSGSQLQGLAVRSIDTLENLQSNVENFGVWVQQDSLDSGSWTISDQLTLNLIDRLERESLTLSEYIGDHVFYGIKTGLGAAFVIDGRKYQELVEIDPRSSEIIRPFIRGRNIEAWSIKWGGDYLIVSKIGTDLATYPAVLAHLSKFKNELEKRDDYKPGTMRWYHLRPCDYYHVFDRPKIVYQRFQVKPAFTIDRESYFTNDAIYIFDLEDYFLVGILNSRVGWYEITRHCTRIQNGYQLIWDYFKNVRIPKLAVTSREKIAALAQQCLGAAQTDPDRLPTLEAELNALVYQAYGLDDDDIAVIEESVK
ncbi:MAG: Eco57I restriction-modification methylase domain-containing protein [Anaerolineaceae bacterium]